MRGLGSVSTAIFFLAVCGVAAQAQETWEGKTVEGPIRTEGFHIVRAKDVIGVLNVRANQPYTLVKRDEDYKILWEKKLFDSIKIDVQPGAGDKIVVTIRVREAPIIKDVIFSGLDAIQLADLRKDLKLNPGSRLTPFELKHDLDTIRNAYLRKGYHFSTVQDERVDTESGVLLHWRVVEGPEVTVREIVFSGNDHIKADDLKDIMTTKENSTLLIPISTKPFVMHNLEEDLKLIKAKYYEEGWLDIGGGNRVFIEDIIFSEDKTEVTIKIHVDEGVRYRINRIMFRGNKIFTEQELASSIESQPGKDYSRYVLFEKDKKKLRAKYGERAYILAEINPLEVFDPSLPQLDIVIDIKENQEIRVGRIAVNGNVKTRSDVILREFKDFAPGERFNSRLLDRGIVRLRDRGYFDPDPQRGIQLRDEPGDQEDTRDIIIDVVEGQTGNIKFAGGYSSAYGILGILELTQRNFDIADLPASAEDFFSGNAFAGGGQFFSIRLAPSAKRQSFTISFREPYLFGYEYGLGLNFFDIRTQREDWTVGRLGAQISLDKRIGNFSMQLGLNASEMSFENIDAAAPLEVQGLEGTNQIFALTPAIAYDTRDSVMFPSEGFRLSLAYQYAGQVLPGDFDFNKATLDADFYFTVLETEEKLKHVLQFHGTFGVADEARLSDSVFIEERFYAGGHDSIRGFEWRGLGPHENGVPVGGKAYMFASAEYSVPFLNVQFLRVAAFYDIAELAAELPDMKRDLWRQTVGFGIRLSLPQLGNVPFVLDFGWPLTREREDERQTVTFDFGKLF